MLKLDLLILFRYLYVYMAITILFNFYHPILLP